MGGGGGGWGVGGVESQAIEASVLPYLVPLHGEGVSASQNSQDILDLVDLGVRNPGLGK